MVVWEHIGRIVCNAAVTGAVAGLSVYFASGAYDPNVSIIAAAMTGTLAFFIELKRYLYVEETKATTNPRKKKGTALPSHLILF